jgi:hypothetical protein
MAEADTAFLESTSCSFFDGCATWSLLGDGRFLGLSMDGGVGVFRRAVLDMTKTLVRDVCALQLVSICQMKFRGLNDSLCGIHETLTT